jgi:tRNA pseudouridine38-40 synthase
MRNIKLTIEYDGTKYAGWQIQKNAVTVQEVLEKAIGGLVGHEVNLIGSSRTDAGVHARGMVANFHTSSGIPERNFPAAINGRLPGDIVIVDAEEVEEGFHSRYCSTGKRYSYKILNRKAPSALLRDYAAHIPVPLDMQNMKAACEYFIGTHDFEGFRSTGSSVKDTVRTVRMLDISEDGDLINIEIEADGFLYNMVRIIAGTLVSVGMGKISVGDIEEIIKCKDRNRAGKTAPAQGLCLDRVYY